MFDRVHKKAHILVFPTRGVSQKTNCFDYRYLFGIGWIGGYAGHIKIKVTGLGYSPR